MKRRLNLLVGLAVFSPFFFSMTSFQGYGQTADKIIASRTADVGGVKLHYLTVGTVHR
ncbi:MAG: hypothetical protein WCC37_25020 [Candidatus Sulfotelmatobacter sp.]|jgi:hypothetical protein